jgi:hypothetical protein
MPHAKSSPRSASASAASSSPAKSKSKKIDPASGEELLESPPADFHFLDVRPLELNYELQVRFYSSVITVGTRDYIALADDAGDGSKEASSVLPPVLADSFVRSQVDIDTAAPAWFKDQIIGIVLKYHWGISWTPEDLGFVIDYPHRIILKEGATPVQQPSRPHLYQARNEAAIKRKAIPFIQLGVHVPCEFSPWRTQLVIAKKSRVCHDFTDLNAQTIVDAYTMFSWPRLVKEFGRS